MVQAVPTCAAMPQSRSCPPRARAALWAAALLLAALNPLLCLIHCAALAGAAPAGAPRQWYVCHPALALDVAPAGIAASARAGAASVPQALYPAVMPAQVGYVVLALSAALCIVRRALRSWQAPPPTPPPRMACRWPRTRRIFCLDMKKEGSQWLIQNGLPLGRRWG